MWFLRITQVQSFALQPCSNKGNQSYWNFPFTALKYWNPPASLVAKEIYRFQAAGSLIYGHPCKSTPSMAYLFYGDGFSSGSGLC